MDDVASVQANLGSRLLNGLHRWRFALALASFAAGSASFVLVERREPLAQWIAALVLLGWLLTLAEGALGRGFARYRWGRFSPLLLRYGVQAIHQETFFFCLPFLLATTTWSHPQALFTAGIAAAALASMWDPLYCGRIAARPWLFLAFHAVALYLAVLTVGPILGHLTTTQTLALASGAMALLALPSLLQLIDRERPLHWALMFGGALALGGASWLLRPWVPPVTLRVQQSVISDAVDPVRKEPGVALRSVPAAHAHQQGLYAWTAIRAPRGLHERVFHRWLQNGREVDRIPLEIVGGRSEGYRAWSYKRGFPADARGEWKVQVITEGGQLIGQLGFRIVGEPATPGASGWGPPGVPPAEDVPPPLDPPEPPLEAAPSET